MSGYFVAPSSNVNIDMSVIQKVFIIASYYFELVLFVDDAHSQADTVYNSPYSCGINVPTPYTTTGFDPTTKDAIIFVVANNEPS